MKTKLSILLITASAFLLAACASTIESTATLLTWRREGGIAGLCDKVIVFANGSFTVATCAGQPRSGQLNATQLEQFADWFNTFKSFEAGADDDLTSFPDEMIIKTTFKGVGTKQASPNEIAAISEFASLLVAQTPDIDEHPEAAIEARDFLADKLGLSADEIKILRAEAVEWPDSCLGQQGQADEICAQVITPGYKVTLEAGGSLYLLYTDQTGENIRQS